MMQRVMYQINNYPKNYIAFQYEVDPAGLIPGTCASANYTVASEWSGCFPEARAWLREAVPDLRLEDTRETWSADGGAVGSFRKQVRKMCFDVSLWGFGFGRC